MSQFDVFLAHNSLDKPLVREIAKKLEQRGLKAWLDEQQIPPGRSFQDEVQQAIPVVKSAAVFIGSQGLGRWQSWELKVFISQCVENNIPVIPVLLPGINSLPEYLVFLKNFRWIHFSTKVDDEKALDLLEWGITGHKPQRNLHFNDEKPGQNPQQKSLKKFDIFLCYNNEDYEEVKEIGRSLKKQNIRPWLDVWETSKGTSWQELLAEVILNINSVAVCIGKNGGPWKQKEMEDLVWEFTELERSVIPVYLKNAPQVSKLPVYLRRLEKVDFREQEKEPIAQLISLIKKKNQQGEA